MIKDGSNYWLKHESNYIAAFHWNIVNLFISPIFEKRSLHFLSFFHRFGIATSVQSGDPTSTNIQVWNVFLYAKAQQILKSDLSKTLDCQLF